MKLLLSRHRGCSKEKIPWLDALTVRRLAAAARSLPPVDAEVGVVVVDDDYIRRINREYRGTDRPTDVISFSYAQGEEGESGGEVVPREGDGRTEGDDASGEADAPPDGEDVAGEVYLSWQTIEARAREQGVPPERLFLRTGVHGLLHVIGHVHEADPDAEVMEAEERRILSQHLTPPEVEELF